MTAPGGEGPRVGSGVPTALLVALGKGTATQREEKEERQPESTLQLCRLPAGAWDGSFPRLSFRFIVSETGFR